MLSVDVATQNELAIVNSRYRMLIWPDSKGQIPVLVSYIWLNNSIITGTGI
jgi:hypothetical protein